MGIRSAGKTIREARESMGLSQEKFSEGICSAYSLSRIESGTSGVSPSTFQALMARAGINCESSPVFASRTDFDCFYILKHARFYLDAWQLKLAYEELEKAEALHWADNRLYYQEWLMLQNRLQFRSGLAAHEVCIASLSDALSLTHPNFDVYDFRSCLLSTTEVEILTLLAQEYLYAGQLPLCLSICSQLYSHLDTLHLNYLEKDRLLAEEGIVYVKYLIATGDYKTAHKIADSNRHTMVLDVQDAPLLELSFLTGLASFHLGDREACTAAFRNTFYAAHSIQSNYATICYHYMKKLDASFITEDMEQLPKAELQLFPIKKTVDTSDFSEGIYDPFSDELFTIGKLIHTFRTEQKLSQTVLCQGLCSKSKLSKIENGTLQPDIFLTEALLQRLGISERIFSFWGNERESTLYELRFKLIHRHLLRTSESTKLLAEFNALLNKDDIILRQTYALFHALFHCSKPEKKILVLIHALNLTLPHFDVQYLLSYRLTWAEINILHEIAWEYKNTSSIYMSDIYFFPLITYLKKDFLDIFLKRSTLTVSLYLYEYVLVMQNRYFDSNQLLDDESKKIYLYNFKHWAGFLFYYAQAQAELGYMNNAKIYMNYCCSISEITEKIFTAVSLKKYLAESFSIIP